MSGPALRQHDSHHAIHQAAFSEAIDLTDAVQHAIDNKLPEARAVVDLLLEHWETRVLRHADEEEQGLYQEIASNDPTMTSTLAGLRRDHDLMRQLWQEIHDEVESTGVAPGLICRFQHFLWLSHMHSQTEEKWLFSKEEKAT